MNVFLVVFSTHLWVLQMTVDARHSTTAKTNVDVDFIFYVGQITDGNDTAILRISLSFKIDVVASWSSCVNVTYGTLIGAWKIAYEGAVGTGSMRGKRQRLIWKSGGVA